MSIHTLDKITPLKDDTEADPYNPTMVLNLLQGTNDWASIQDIVKLTFKAIFDVVKSHGEALRDLESIVKEIPTRVDLSNLLSTKLGDFNKQLDSKITAEEARQITLETNKSMGMQIEEYVANTTKKIISLSSDLAKMGDDIESKANKVSVA